jgi:putative N6-adenine-specific DNA methylase
MAIGNENEYRLIAKTFFGLEPVLAEELKKIGAKEVKIGRRMVSFAGGKEILYKANIYLRSALRILKEIHSFEIENLDQYYSCIHEIEWEKYLNLHHSIAIDAVITSKLFNNSLYAAQRAKDAIVDRFREKYSKRPEVDTHNPSILINIHLSEKRLNISLDSSGESLHKRGYRAMEGEAPINQVLAASLIYLSGWDYTTPFVDPMTGSGTLAIEAAMIARNMPPGMLRKDYCFKNWLDYDRKIYQSILDNIELNDVKPAIYASDISNDALSIARNNASKANISSFIRFSNNSFTEFVPPLDKIGTVIINPPYGERIKLARLEELYQEIGNTLKEKYAGYKAWIISANIDAMKHIGLKSAAKIKLYNGSLDCTYSRFDIFKGSLKEFKETDEDKNGSPE